MSEGESKVAEDITPGKRDLEYFIGLGTLFGSLILIGLGKTLVMIIGIAGAVICIHGLHSSGKESKSAAGTLGNVMGYLILIISFIVWFLVVDRAF